MYYRVGVGTRDSNSIYKTARMRNRGGRTLYDDLSKDDRFYFDLPNGEVPDFLHTDVALQVFSARVRKYIDSFQKSHVYYCWKEAIIYNAETRESKTYFVFISPTLDLLDYDMSDMVEYKTKDHGSIFLTEFPVVDESKTFNYPIFRQRHFEGSIFVSEALKEGLENIHFTGANYYKCVKPDHAN